MKQRLGLLQNINVTSLCISSYWLPPVCFPTRARHGPFTKCWSSLRCLQQWAQDRVSSNFPGSKTRGLWLTIWWLKSPLTGHDNVSSDPSRCQDCNVIPIYGAPSLLSFLSPDSQCSVHYENASRHYPHIFQRSFLVYSLCLQRPFLRVNRWASCFQMSRFLSTWW